MNNSTVLNNTFPFEFKMYDSMLDLSGLIACNIILSIVYIITLWPIVVKRQEYMKNVFYYRLVLLIGIYDIASKWELMNWEGST